MAFHEGGDEIAHGLAVAYDPKDPDGPQRGVESRFICPYIII